MRVHCGRTTAWGRAPFLQPRPGLALVAAAHHISTRQLQRLCRAPGLTVAGGIRRRRLEPCHHDLSDPGRNHLTVQAITGRRGSTDGPHFNRVFRAACGRPPGGTAGPRPKAPVPVCVANGPAPGCHPVPGRCWRAMVNGRVPGDPGRHPASSFARSGMPELGQQLLDQLWLEMLSFIDCPWPDLPSHRK
ncbi:helix-turn-helix domain-containing protein [Streptomyces griseoluteus]|uniref:helix-turn-helix domain-containing protein n=1 Tax=Streptomyces griseoluteus TaxID=29306 RepID=UPI0036FFB661